MIKKKKNNNNNLNPLLISKLTIKTYLQLVSLKKKNIQSKHYLQVISFPRAREARARGRSPIAK